MTQMGAMNEYETLMVVSECLNLALTSLGIYMTVMSGFLVTIYTVGKKLTKGQVRFLSFIFLFFCFFAIWGSISYFAAAELFLKQVQSIPDNMGWLHIMKPSILVGFLQIVGLIGAFSFLRSIRNKPSL